MTELEPKTPDSYSALSDALRGVVHSQYKLAIILEEEENDFELAGAWYKKAAMQGHSEAAYRAGMLCLRMHNNEAHEAVYWLGVAASQGHTGAQYNLAMAHERGKGVRLDPEEALKWHRLAARHGHPDSLAKLASMDSWINFSS